MQNDWMSDARQIPDEVMTYIRKIAVTAVNVKGYHPDDVVDMLGFSRSCIYDWLNRFRQGGYEALETRKAPGASAVITEEMDRWLKTIVLSFTPESFGYDTQLWTSTILADLLKKQYGIQVQSSTVTEHLHQLDLSFQKPSYRPQEQDEEEVEQFLNDKFPRIQRLAERLGAEIAFEDEAGVELREHAGRTWGQMGETPEIHVTGKRGKYNVLSIVTKDGTFEFAVKESTVNSEVLISFFKQLLNGRKKPLILLLDRAPFHKSPEVREYVRSHRHQLRIYFLPKYSPELNPDEQVWEEIKDNRLRRQPIKDKKDLKQRLHSALDSLKQNAGRVKSFFQLPETKYAAT